MAADPKSFATAQSRAIGRVGRPGVVERSNVLARTALEGAREQRLTPCLEYCS